MQIAIFRKEAEVKYAPRASATALAPVLAMLAAVCRVQRPELVAHFLPTGKGRSGFARQDSVTRSELHHLADCRRAGVLTPEATATLAKAWIVPESELGRKPKNGGERDWLSTGQSILIYCKDRIGVISLERADIFTVDPEGSDISVTVID
jgi:hypothetical protein